MTSGWARLAGAVVLVVLAPQPARAQHAVELGVQAVATASDPELVAAGPLVAVRPDRRARVTATAALGGSANELAWRGEVLGQFLLDPLERRGVGVYAGGGLAAVGGPVDAAYITMVLGVEGRPGRSHGWTAEIGFGGGVRIAVGYRWRRFAPGRNLTE